MVERKRQTGRPDFSEPLSFSSLSGIIGRDRSTIIRIVSAAERSNPDLNITMVDGKILPEDAETVYDLVRKHERKEERRRKKKG